MHDLALHPTGRASGTEDACLFGLSLCSGAGGLDLGLTIAIPGYRAVGYVERETYAAATLVAITTLRHSKVRFGCALTAVQPSFCLHYVRKLALSN